MVGNDVVDLRDPESAPETLHPRFDTRVFSEAERAAIAASPDAARLRWKLWAAKEAAYKLARKISPTTIFAPARFEVALGDVGRVIGLVDEHVIPRAILGRTGSGNRFVPLVAALERGIDVEHDATISKFLVMDDLADEEPGRLGHGSSVPEPVGLWLRRGIDAHHGDGRSGVRLGWPEDLHDARHL